MSRNDRRTFPSPSAAEEPFFVEIDEPASAPSIDVDQPPQWFRPNREPSPPASKTPPRSPANGKSRQNPPKRSAPVVPEDEPEEELSWQERFKRWVLGEGGMGYGISVALHVVALLIMSLWVLNRPQEEDLVTTLAESEVVDMASIQDVEIEELETELEPQALDPLFDPAPLSEPNIGINTPASSLTNTTPGGLELKIPQQAVTKGSFTVWTEPADPEPGEKYIIWIQVKLKNDIKRYPRRDLSGSIVGTDGYKDYFGGPTEPGYLRIDENNTVRYEALTVPGAAQLVKDIINVESKILNEKQTIELVF